MNKTVYTSYRNVPYLKSLQSGYADFIIHADPNEWISMHGGIPESIFDDYSFTFRDVTLVSETFADAIQKNKNIVNKIINSSLDDFNRICGTYILGELIISTNCDILNKNILLYAVTKSDNRLVAFCQYDSFYNNGEGSFIDFAITPLKEHFKTESNRDVVFELLYKVLCIEAFKKYADVETIHVEGKSKKRDSGNKYVNKTDLPVTHLNRTWFTNIIRSKGFDVRGHFRRQQYKIDGKWTRKLKWIKPHRKNGYTSKARKTTL